MFKNIFIILFLIIKPFMPYAQEGFSSVSVWIDSSYHYLDGEDVEQTKLEDSEINYLNKYFKDNNEVCKLLRLKLFESNHYKNSAKYDIALKKRFEFDSLYTSDCDSNLLIRAMIIEANIYFDNMQYEHAEDLLNKALEEYKESWGDYRRKSGIYNVLGNIKLMEEDYQEAIYYYEKGFKTLDKDKDNYRIQVYLFNIAIANYNLGRLDSVKFYTKMCLREAKKSGNIIMQSRTFNFLGRLSEDNYQKLAYLDSSIAIAKSNNLLNDMVDLLENKTIVLEKLGKDNEAYNILWDANHLRDTLYQIQTSEAIALNVKYQNSQKDLEIKELKITKQDSELKAAQYESNQTKMFYGGGILICAIIVLAFRFYETRKTKNLLSSKNEIITKEKNKSEELLLNILPSDVADELKEKGYSDAKDFEMATVLFTDFKEFTSVSQKLSAKVLVEEINVFFKEFDHIVEKNKIEKIKTIGDSYMAVGGIPLPSNDSVLNTVNAALEMQDFIIKRKKEAVSKGKPAFEMRVGIHTGPVVAGIVGVKKFQYDIWGDTVNTASRMENNGIAGKVNISQSTYNILKSNKDFIFESRGKLEVKGKGEMEMWFISKRNKNA